MTNIGMTIITESWRSDDLILAISKIPEKYDELADALYDIVQDTQSLTEITVNG